MSPTAAKPPNKLFDRKLGLFIHWGLYAIPAWHEQHVFRRHMTRAEYAPLINKFNPRKFNPDQWLDIAQEAGMEYLCFTTKHIDGFCMWDTKETEFKITNTPYKKDTLRLLADACHRRKFPLSLYYSVVDNHQPNYPHAGRPYEFTAPQPGDEPDESRYVNYLKRQVTELCTQYGKIAGFWWDGNVLKRQDPTVNALIHKLQPDIMINDRGMSEGDFTTSERDYDPSVQAQAAFQKPLEACQAVGSESWSYRAEEAYYSDGYIIGSIQKMIAKGANYLLNIGPKADGTFPREVLPTLKRIGRWHASIKESLTKVTNATSLTENRDIAITKKGNTLYIHLYKEPISNAIHLYPIKSLPFRATLLQTGEEIDVAIRDLPRYHAKAPHSTCLSIINLPLNRKQVTGWVIKLEFKKIEVHGQSVVGDDTDKLFLGSKKKK